MEIKDSNHLSAYRCRISEPGFSLYSPSMADHTCRQSAATVHAHSISVLVNIFPILLPQVLHHPSVALVFLATLLRLINKAGHGLHFLGSFSARMNWAGEETGRMKEIQLFSDRSALCLKNIG